MNMKDLYSKLGLVNVIDPAVYTADNTPAAIDLQDFKSALLAIHVGVGGITFSPTNKIEFKLTHSDDNVTYTDVADDHVQGATGVTSGIVKALTAAHATADVTPIGYRGGKRYLKLLADFSGTHGTGTPIAVTLIKGDAALQPVNS